MNDLQIHDRIKEDFADLTLNQPIATVMSRGRQLRQRRRRLPMLGVLTIGTFAAVITVQASAHQSTAFAAWTSHAQTTDSRTAAAIDHSCRAQANIPAAMPLRVLDRRGNFALSIYTDGHNTVACHRFRGSKEQPFTRGVTTFARGNAWSQVSSGASAVTPAHPVVLEARSGLSIEHEGSAVSTYGWVAPAVVKVIINSGDYTTVATLSDGLFSAWWPGDATGKPKAVACTAYNAEGKVIGHDTIKAG